MKFLLPLSAVVVFAVTLAKAVFPPMPESVASGGEELRALWTTASRGTFMNVLPPNMAGIQDDWTHFLLTEGEDIVNQYYREAFRGVMPKAAKFHGHGKYVKMVNFELTQPYQYHPNTDPHKPNVAALLIETFANRPTPARKAQWAKDLRLGRPGTAST